MVPADFDMHFFRGIRDSKQLTADRREAWYGKIRQAQREGTLSYAVSLASHAVIDRRGIVPAVSTALFRTLKRLSADPSACRVLLDGNLKAPAIFAFQKTIIRGDVTEPLISAAAIMAKVTRDRLMRRMGDRYPQYGFETHKGYGTRMHRAAILRYGLCAIHRATFCTSMKGAGVLYSITGSCSSYSGQVPQGNHISS